MSILRVKIKRRLLYLAFGAAAFLIAYSVGAAIPLTYLDAPEVRKQFSGQVRSIDQNGIFFNNVRIALGMFIPAAGAALGIFSGFSTGTVFSALVNSSTALKGVPPLAILITPFGIMEVFSYGLAISRSGMLVYQLINLAYRSVKKRPWREYLIPILIKTGIEIGVVIIVLLIGSIIEW